LPRDRPGLARGGILEIQHLDGLAAGWLGYSHSRCPLPGVGQLIFQAIANRDILVVEDCVMLLAAIVIAVNFLVDVACASIDPRLRRLAA